jgi:hypothetical protein
MVSEENIGQQLQYARPVYSGPGLAGFGRAFRWNKYALSERKPDEIKGEPGARWGRDVALVPVSKLNRYREYDRTGAQAHPDSEQIINSIADDLRKGGVNAMREPVYLDYNHETNYAYLGEGHHRLEAAKRAGLTHIPVRVIGSVYPERFEKRKSLFRGAPLHMDTRLVEGDGVSKRNDGYWSNMIHPGNFQEFEGAR